MSERTEAPTGRRLSRAREEGNVCKSQELNNAVSLLIGAWLLNLLGRQLVASLSQMLKDSLNLNATMEINGEWLRGLAFKSLINVGPWVGLFIGGMLLIGVVTTVSQTGFLWAGQRLGLKLDRLNPLTGLQRMFSLNGLVELVKALIKLLLVGYVVYAYLQSRVSDLMNLVQMDFVSAVSLWTSMAYDLILRAAMAYAVLGAIDYAYQRWNWNRSMKMTKEEVKEDNKLSEGDPFIRGRIRQQQRRMARMRMMANVKKADVIITNPTHLAIAIQYDAQSMKAPKVLAKGADLIAEQIVKVAREHSIPIVQNIPLARAIFKTVALDQEVPPALYVAMAQVMAYVYRLKGKAVASHRPAPVVAATGVADPLSTPDDMLVADNPQPDYGFSEVNP